MTEDAKETPSRTERRASNALAGGSSPSEITKKPGLRATQYVCLDPDVCQCSEEQFSCDCFIEDDEECSACAACLFLIDVDTGEVLDEVSP
jgi:hypothetical protein